MSIELAKPASPTWHLSELQYNENFIFFVLIRFSRLGVLFLLIDFLHSRSSLYPRSVCFVDCLREPKGALRFT